MEEKEKGIHIFGYPIRDWIILFIMLASVFTGGAVIGGTPGGTKDAITNQTEELSTRLDKLYGIMSENSRISQRNVLRIDAIEGSIDSLRETTLMGLRNLDGYFRGRLDQIDR